MQKCIVSHAGNRDYYQIALALQELSALDSLVTDVYIPDLLNNFFNKNQPITSAKTRIAKKSFIEFLKRKAGFKYDFSISDKAISKYSLELAIKKECNLLSYSYYAYDAFRYLKDHNLPNKRFLFQLHPHPKSIIEILSGEIERLPFTRKSILLESEFSFSDQAIQDLGQEVFLSDHCFVASSFTKRTLIENGADEDKITIIPYGIDHNKFTAKTIYSKSNDIFNIIFVGSMVQRKGLADLLQAMRILNSDKIKLTLIGRTFLDNDLLEHFKDVNFSLMSNISHVELLNQLHKSDVFILPSLVEGFAHVILEAMACGIPVIATENTCAPDVLTNNEQGYIIPIKNPLAIAEKIEYLLENREECNHMGLSASKRAENYTWTNFREGIRNNYLELIK